MRTEIDLPDVVDKKQLQDVHASIAAFNSHLDELYLRVQANEHRMQTNLKLVATPGLLLQFTTVVDIVSALQRGQKIAAIKELKAAAPYLSLKEAKDYVENLQRYVTPTGYSPL